MKTISVTVEDEVYNTFIESHMGDEDVAKDKIKGKLDRYIRGNASAFLSGKVTDESGKVSPDTGAVAAIVNRISAIKNSEVGIAVV